MNKNKTDNSFVTTVLMCYWRASLFDGFNMEQVYTIVRASPEVKGGDFNELILQYVYISY